MPIWNPEYECLSRADMRALQLTRLQSSVSWAYDNSPWYRAVLDKAQVSPRDVRSLDDLRRLPFTDKTALRDSYPFGLLALPLRDIVRLHSSSGTTGKPVVVGYSRADLNAWTEVCARVASMAGVVASDRVDMTFLYGMFTGGWGMHYGVERIGATVIPAGAGSTERHLMMLADFGTTVFVGTPSYAIYLAEVGEKAGVDFATLPIRLGLFGGEATSTKMREEIEARLHIRATDNYGLSEVGGPGVAGECEIGLGRHVNEDHFYPEIVDPSSGEPVPFGEEGELVLTTLTKEAMPILRFRTHDLTRFVEGPCACGRTTVRIEPIRNRTDDMLIIRGVNVFPSQVEDILFSVEGTTPHYLLVVERKSGLDSLELRIEIDARLFSDRMAPLVEMQEQISERVQNVLGLRVQVTLVEPGSIERTQGKSKRVLDRR
ncbi:MAG: phenylacetate--CoA ligase [Actinomycetes bacterium]|jgi:phenylacetate-CoA ligase|nr:phenylacetate--CoA ligase [Actinomycetes bacterium]